MKDVNAGEWPKLYTQASYKSFKQLGLMSKRKDIWNLYSVLFM